MKKLLKPASLLFNILSLLVFFVLGMYYAGWIEAGKNQGLAGGAIVFGYGVMFGGVAFVLSFFAAYRLSVSAIKKINWILLPILIATIAIKYFEFKKRDAAREQTGQMIKQNILPQEQIYLIT